MKILDPTFQANLARSVTSIAWCWLIERLDGLSYGFTSFDLMLRIDGLQFEPFTGFTPTADSNNEGLQKNNSQDLQGLLTSEQISATDLLAGKFDRARVTCFLVDVTNLPISLAETPPKFLLIYQRYIKRVVHSDLGFKLELRDDDWKLETKLGKQTSKFCEHDLGDSNCKVDLTTYTFTQAITNIINRYEFTIDGSFDVDQFTRGKITFHDGANKDIIRDVARFEANKVILWQPLPYSLAVGETVTIVQGCGKTLYDCVVRYDNAYNSDSEPHIPTNDLAINPPIEN